jgi:hypothetical protein
LPIVALLVAETSDDGICSASVSEGRPLEKLPIVTSVASLLLVPWANYVLKHDAIGTWGGGDNLQALLIFALDDMKCSASASGGFTHGKRASGIQTKRER